MKRLLLSGCLALACISAHAEKLPFTEMRSLYSHLVDINSNWAKYIREEGDWARPVSFESDQAFIATDLLLVEQFLRGRDVSGLSAELRAARKRNLDEFHDYILAGNFPKNYDHEERRPCFIDRDGGVCAVGNLLVKSGQKDLAYYLASNYEYAYVKEMNVEKLVEWQKTSGLTLEELGLVQPSYYGGGHRNSYKRDYGFQLGAVYGQDIAAFNTTRDIFSLRPENYRHMYSFQYGISILKNFNSGTGFFETGIYQLSDKYLYQVEGTFGSGGQYGKIISELNPQYVSVPLLFGFWGGDSRDRTAFKIGYRGDYLQSLGNSVIAFGSPGPQDIFAYSFTKADYHPWRSNILMGGMIEHKLGDHFRFRIETNLLISLTPDQKGVSTLTYRPVKVGFNSGLIYGVPYNKQKHDQRVQKRKKRKADRLQRRQMRKQKKEQEKKKKEEEKDKKVKEQEQNVPAP